MKRFFIVLAAAISLQMIACGDDSSSNAGGSSVSQTASLFVDEKEQLLVMTVDEQSEDQCVINGETYTWKSVKQRSLPDSNKYEFLGDTLILYGIDEGDVDHRGEMYVGGSANNLYGTWKHTSCYYNSTDKEKKCHEKDARYIEQSLTFSENKATARVEVFFDRYLDDLEKADFMKSYFVEDLYSGLNGSDYFEAYASDILDTYEDEEDLNYLNRAIEENGVQIEKSNNKSQTFTIGDKTYTVEIKKLDITLADNFNANEDISIDVTDGETTCNARYIRKYMNKNLCVSDNAKYFDLEEEIDSDGNEYTYVYYYRDRNFEEFKECLASIAVKKKNSAESDDNALYKKAYIQKQDLKGFREKQLRKFLKYVEK